MAAFLQRWLLLSLLLCLSALLVICSAQLKVYSETDMKVEPQENSDPSSFAVIVCNVEPVNATVPTRWILPNGQMISDSFGRFRVGQGSNGNGIWSTILAIQNISYQDAGYYTCEVVPSSISRSLCECVDFPFSTTTHLQLQVNLIALEEDVVITEGSTRSVQLGCEMKGYLRPDKDLNWYKDGQPLPLDGVSHSIFVKEGSPGAGQNGKNRTVHSRISVLSINDPTVPNSGVYSCQIRGTKMEANMSLTVAKSSLVVPATDMPSPSKGQGTDDDVTAVTEKPSRGNKFDGKNGRDLPSGANGNTSGVGPSCSLGVAEVLVVIGTTCTITAVISVLLTLTVTCLCLKRRHHSEQSVNRSKLVPSPSDGGREIDSTNSMSLTVNTGACEGECSIPYHNSRETQT